jgi:hypothetical protein
MPSILGIIGIHSYNVGDKLILIIIEERLIKITRKLSLFSNFVSRLTAYVLVEAIVLVIEFMSMKKIIRRDWRESGACFYKLQIKC